jgi:hypothetical protein
MDNFVERIEQTNYQILGPVECLVSANNFNEQSQRLEFVSGERWLVVLPVSNNWSTVQQYRHGGGLTHQA